MMFDIIIVFIMGFIAFIDIKKGIIPWQLLLAVFIVMVLKDSNVNIIVMSLVSSISIGIFLHSLRYVLNQIYKKDTLGMGDIHLLMVMTFGLHSIELSLYVLVIGSYLALFYMMIQKKHVIPFGPFLIISWIGVSHYQIFYR